MTATHGFAAIMGAVVTLVNHRFAITPSGIVRRKPLPGHCECVVARVPAVFPTIKGAAEGRYGADSQRFVEGRADA